MHGGGISFPPKGIGLASFGQGRREDSAELVVEYYPVQLAWRVAEKSLAKTVDAFRDMLTGLIRQTRTKPPQVTFLGPFIKAIARARRWYAAHFWRGQRPRGVGNPARRFRTFRPCALQVSPTRPAGHREPHDPAGIVASLA